MADHLLSSQLAGPSRELILGGQRSGKSRCAEARAAAWLALPGHEAVLIATALAGDAEMQARIAQHRQDRARRLPQIATDEVPLALAAAIACHSAPQRLVVVDCLTLWLTNLLLPVDATERNDGSAAAEANALDRAVQQSLGPVVLVSNEIGLGVSPLGAGTRCFVDTLGRLHQQLAARCTRVTWMLAGIEVPVKGGAR